MQASAYVLDSYDSILIFDRICPFAIEQLPIMSRRVFDVGLDLNRIRNGLKPNKENKRSKSYRSNSIKEDTFKDESPVSNQQNDLVPWHKKSNPSIATQRHLHGQPDEAALLPSPHPNLGMDTESALLHLRPTPPDAQANGNWEHSLHSSQISPLRLAPMRRRSQSIIESIVQSAGDPVTTLKISTSNHHLRTPESKASIPFRNSSLQASIYASFSRSLPSSCASLCSSIATALNQRQYWYGIWRHKRRSRPWSMRMRWQKR